MSQKLNEDNLLLSIQQRLDVLIALSLKKEMKKDKSLKMRDMIVMLSSLGLKYTDIANILGRSPSYIASELTLMKKKGKKNV
jgi:hypothetical protein